MSGYNQKAKQHQREDKGAEEGTNMLFFFILSLKEQIITVSFLILITSGLILRLIGKNSIYTL